MLVFCLGMEQLLPSPLIYKRRAEDDSVHDAVMAFGRRR
jgi:hypothetical protein